MRIINFYLCFYELENNGDGLRLVGRHIIKPNDRFQIMELTVECMCRWPSVWQQCSLRSYVKLQFYWLHLVEVKWTILYSLFCNPFPHSFSFSPLCEISLLSVSEGTLALFWLYFKLSWGLSPCPEQSAYEIIFPYYQYKTCMFLQDDAYSLEAIHDVVGGQCSWGSVAHRVFWLLFFI